jgi:DNA-binding MarR family transcriptional regulator
MKPELNEAVKSDNSQEEVTDGGRSRNIKLNELLVNLFFRVMDTEEKAVITDEYKDITNNDMHIIEAIGINEPRSMSVIAKQLGVTVGTLSVNMNSLEKKDYILRERSSEDKRVVHVTLTEKGRKAFFHHRDFHRAMIRSAVNGLNEEEMTVLINCLQKLSDFFQNGQI